MTMAGRTNILVAEPSPIIRIGLVSLLKRLDSLSLKIAEISDIGSLYEAIESFEVEILIINPMYLGQVTPDKIRAVSHNEKLKVVCFQSTAADQRHLKLYDDVISIYDIPSQIQDKLEKIINSNQDSDNQISARETEIIACIAKGYSNKEISDKLFISVNTVMTHRRNIMSKLQIHSQAGLTIYAIVNKIIDINDVK